MKRSLRQAVLNETVERPRLLCRRFDQALVGSIASYGDFRRPCYDYRKCVEIVAARSGLEALEAEHLFQGTMARVSGEMGPAYITFFREEDSHEQRCAELGNMLLHPEIDDGMLGVVTTPLRRAACYDYERAVQSNQTLEGFWEGFQIAPSTGRPVPFRLRFSDWDNLDDLMGDYQEECGNEWMENNVLGAWYGPSTPMFLIPIEGMI